MEPTSLTPSNFNPREDGGPFTRNSIEIRSQLSLRKISTKDFASDVKKLQGLACKGQWRALLEMVKEARNFFVLLSPNEQITYSTYHVLALMKLGSYGAASDELASIGDLDGPKYHYEQYSDLYPGQFGSMVPFSLKWLHAELPHRLGMTTATIDRLYSLLDFCSRRYDDVQAKLESASMIFASDPVSVLLTGLTDGTTDSLPVAPQPLHDDFHSNERAVDSPKQPSALQTLLGRWKRRREIVLFSILNHHLSQREFMVALNLLNQLLESKPSDPILWSKFGYVQLQLGDFEGAKATFLKVEGLTGEESLGALTDTSFACLLARNEGLHSFVEKKYPAAIKAFNAVLERNPEDAVAANNKALCLMYSRDLIKATQVLEEMLQTHTLVALNETLVLNLCSMYELASVNSIESKRTLSAWMLQIAPDDFDLTCTRL
ncbi:hypothetical protein O6H91_14G041800 [Diphasiastrum complanatum]|nr:hypothetical protein O6H91_14G041800 [Diphasiastrum complanatum]